MARLTDSERAMLRSQGGPLALVPLSTTPSNFLSRVDSRFGFSCFVACACPSLSVHVNVGVAVPSTPLAITALHVPELGFWGGGASQLRVPGPESAARQGAESWRMKVFVSFGKGQGQV